MRSVKVPLMTVLAGLSIYLTVTFASTTGQIKGRITTQETGDPVIGASVLVVGTTQGAITDVDGKFQILRVDPGTYTLRISSVAFRVRMYSGMWEARIGPHSTLKPVLFLTSGAATPGAPS